MRMISVFVSAKEWGDDDGDRLFILEAMMLINSRAFGPICPSADMTKGRNLIPRGERLLLCFMILSSSFLRMAASTV